MLSQKSLKMEPLRLAKMHFLLIVMAMKYVILNYVGKEGFYRLIIRISHIFNHTFSGKRKFAIKTKIKA